jgi:hypothetical protein
VESGISDQNDNFIVPKLLFDKGFKIFLQFFWRPFSFCLLLRAIFKADEHESLDI